MMPPPPPPSGGTGGSVGTMMPPPSGSYMPPSNENYHPPEAGMTPPPSPGGGPGEARYAPSPSRPGSESEIRARMTEDMTRKMTEDMTNQITGEMRSRHENRGMPQGGGQGMEERSGRRMMQERGGPQGGFVGRPEMGERGMMGGQGGFGEHGMMKSGGQEMGDMGDNSEQMEQMMQEQEGRMKAEQLKQMKHGVVSGMEQGLKQIKRMADRLSKKGIAIPADVSSLVNELSAALEKVKAATEMSDEVEAAMEVIQDKGQDLGEVGQKLGLLEQLSQMAKQVEKQFSILDKSLAKAKKRKEASQYPAVVAKIESQINALKQKWTEAKEAVLSGSAEPEDMRDVMEGIFEEIGEAHRSVEMLRQLGSVAKMLRSANKEIATFEKQIERQRKAGKDVSRLEELLAQGKTKLAEVKALTEQSGFEPEELFDLMQELEHIGNEAHQELERISGAADAKTQSGAVIQSLQLRRLGF